MSKKTNLLFICSRNQWRSPTAEDIWNRKPPYKARSVGTSPHAQRTVKIDDIRWADVIFVMEPKHKEKLLARFRRNITYKLTHILDIPDNYKYMG